MQLVARVRGAVHGAVAHDKHPGGLLAVDVREIVLQPLVLRVGLGVLEAAVDGAEGAAVGDVGL